MSFKTVSVVLFCVFQCTLILCIELDDDAIWEKLIQDLPSDSVDPLPSDSDNDEQWKILEKDLDSVEDHSNDFALNQDGTTANDDFNFDLRTTNPPESTEALFERVSRQPMDTTDWTTRPARSEDLQPVDSEFRGANSKPKPGQTSLVIIFDGTGSMLDDLKQLQTGAKDIIQEITKRENNPIYNYIFVPFRDPNVGPVVNTVNQTELLKALEHVDLIGGGDCPESSIGGINAGLEVALPKSFVYVFTDAIAQDYKFSDETIKIIQEKQITITFLLTGFCNSKQSEGYYVYETLAAISNGQVYNLQKTDIKDVLEAIKQFLDANLIPISYVYSQEAGAQNIELDVSKNLKEFTVSLAGDKPNITVLDPNREEYTQKKDVVDLENLKIVNVQDPQPGKWNVQTQSESEHSVKLTAVSDVIFKFGFSTSQPDSIARTEINPIRNVNNFLVISTSNNSLLYNLTSAEIILFNTKEDDPTEKRNVQINLPLTIPNPSDCNNDSCHYVTKAFPPPLSLFKIYVNGFDSDGNPLKYLLSTAIQAINGEVPRVSINESFIEVTESENVNIYCKVISATPAAVHWLIGGEIRDAIATSEKDIWKYELKDTKLKDAGKYICNARNVHGKDKSQTTLIVKEKILPLQVKMVESNMVSAENDSDYQISCYISPRQSVKIIWLFNEEKIQAEESEDLMTQNDNLVLLRVNRKQAGQYKCVVSNGRETKNATGNLSIFYEPEIVGPTKEDRTVLFGEQVMLECDATGNPTPTVIWHRENLSEVVDNTIEMFKPTDQGLYLCEVSNGIGRAAWKEVRLEGAAGNVPNIPRRTSSIINRGIGDDLLLECQCSECEPVYYYKWSRFDDADRKDNEQILIGDGPNRDEYSKSFRYDLHLKKLNESNNGYYICEIGNQHGIDKIVIRINILEKPFIEDITSEENIDGLEGMIKVRKGLDIRMNCQARGSPIPEIHWQKDGVGLPPSTNIYSIGTSLIIRNVTENDMGEYTCVASNSLGTASKEVLLYVVVPPVISPQKDTIISTEEGQTVQILCDVFAMPFPDLKWTMNNKELNLTDKRYTVAGGEISFVAEYGDNGLYRCVATNEAGKAAMEVVVIVYVPPTIYPEEDDSISVRSGRNVTLKCRAEGYPVPDIVWTFDGEQLSNSTNMYQLLYGDLLLINVSNFISGPYICEAVNKIGEKQRTTFVTVTEPPQVLSHFDQEINVTTDTSFSLICAAKGTPRPDIFWAKDGEKYTDGAQQHILDVTFGKIFTGNYTCIAQSPEGADTKTVAIYAIEPPRLNDLQSILRVKFNVTEGENLEIPCPYINAKKITWYKDDFRFYNEPSKSVNVLSLPAATLSDRGNYTCFAENEAGSRNFTQEVKVLAPPRIVTNDVVEKFGDVSDIPEVTVKAGEDLEIICPMEGFPQPKVKWMKDNTVISTEPELILKNVQPYHDGRYDCEARNVLGSADYSYIVKILAAPSTHLPKKIWKEVHEGDNVELECTFSGYPIPKITWEHNGVALTENSATLTRKAIQSKEKGTYICVGTNSVGSNEITYTIDVLESPKFLFINDNVNISESDDLMLRCAARGNPLPVIVWTYNGQMILGSSKIPRTFEKAYALLDIDEMGNPKVNLQSNDVALSNGNSSNSHNNENSNNNLNENHKDNFYGKVFFEKDSLSLMLVIKSAKRKLPGLYTCHALNALGNTEETVQVVVLVAPYLEGRSIDRQPTMNLTLLGGLPLILFCPWRGEPAPTVQWFKNNIHINSDYRVQVSHDGHTLTLLSTDTFDSGIYQCRAQNDAGFGHRQFHVDILAPPYFRLGNTHMMKNSIDDNAERIMDEPPRQIKPGEKIVFNCPVSGNPQPAVFWVEKLNNDEKYTRILQETTTQLVLNNIDKSATYTCYANNSLGQVEKQYEVVVLKTPEIRDFQPEQTIYEHRTITLTCPVTGGSPKPEISWRKNGQEVLEIPKGIFFSQDRSVIKILNAKKDDSGIYTCRAVNAAGHQEKDINVTVITPVVWSDWQSWTPCSQSCGLGVTTRKRLCTLLNGEPSTTLDPACVGRSLESKTCELAPCPIDGAWGQWSNWTTCSKSCWNPNEKSKPTKKRYRDCDSPKPAMGGKSCLGSDYEEIECNTVACTINGGWSSWTVWSPCSVSCGSGFATRYRECNNPVPLHGGQICIGSALESQVCYAGPCPMHGGWSDWSPWSECSQSCGIGYKKRKRSCTNPEPRYGGLHCLGDNVEITKCRIRKCKHSEVHERLNGQELFKPAVQFDLENMYTPKDSADFSGPEADDISYDYATGSTSYSTIPDNSRTTKSMEYDPEIEGTRVIVKMEKLTPIDKDTTQISLHPGMDPIVIKKIIPCALGYQLDSNGTCSDVDECLLPNICGSNEICSNSIGSFKCFCRNGYQFNNGSDSCEDIDECFDPATNVCSHQCKNTPGSFMCTCPSGQILAQDLRSCFRLASTTNDYQMSDPAADSFESKSDCFDGYYMSDGSCQDIDECMLTEDDCGIDQTCLNTKGSYICIPTDCPDEYTRDEISGQCVLMCDPMKRCSEGAKISQTLSYTLLTLDNLQQSEPFLKIVNYDINRIPLPETKFNLEKNTDATLFRLATIPFRKGIAYLYGSKKITKEKLYSVKVNAYSYDSKNVDLLYVTKFVIYLYIN